MNGRILERYVRLAPSVAEAPAQTDDNTFQFIFSNEKVGRDGHVVLNKGIQYGNYLRNPVVLWAHDDREPPVGRGSNIDTSGLSCRMDVTFVSRDILPFAGVVRDLVAGRWLRALSMSWQPIKWQYSKDPARPGGVDFVEVDLLEISIVPLPALPDALLDARSRGVDTAPLFTWASRALDTRMYRGVARPLLEGICRAARMPVSVQSLQSPQARARAEARARRHRIQEIQDRWERMERARRLRAGESLHYATVDRTKLRLALTHHRSAARHHRAASQHHERAGEQLEKLQGICARAVDTLSELGARSAQSKMAGHLEALTRCVRSMGENHEDLDDSLLDLGYHLEKASACVGEVLDANVGEPETADDESADA